MPISNFKKVLVEFDNSKATELEYEDSDFRIVVRKNIFEEERQENNCSSKYITSPLVGSYHDAPLAIHVGQKICEGETLCIVESMKIMNKICAPTDLIIKTINFRDGEVVEYNSRLFEVDYL